MRGEWDLGSHESGRETRAGCTSIRAPVQVGSKPQDCVKFEMPSRRYWTRLKRTVPLTQYVGEQSSEDTSRTYASRVMETPHYLELYHYFKAPIFAPSPLP
jgi:hypothetical protein